MENEVERLERSRRRMLTGFAVAFVAWQLPEVLAAAIGSGLPVWGRGLVTLLTVAGVFGFLWYGGRMLALAGKLAEEQDLADALDDERVRVLRSHAFAAGFWTLLVYLGLLHAATLLVELPAVGAFIRLGLVIGVVVPIATYLWMDRDAADGGK